MSSLYLALSQLLLSLVGILCRLWCRGPGPGTLWEVCEGVAVGGFAGSMCGLVVRLLLLSWCVLVLFDGGCPICLYHVLDAEVV